MAITAFVPDPRAKPEVATNAKPPEATPTSPIIVTQPEATSGAPALTTPVEETPPQQKAELPMADSTTPTTTVNLVEGGHRHNDSGRFADRMAQESIHTTKDIANQLVVIANRSDDSFGRVGVQAERNVGVLGVQAEKLGAAVALQNEKLAAAAALQAHQIAAIAAAAAAECCCELKAAIITDGEKTRDLVNEIERARQALMLTDAKIELSNSKQNEYLRGLIATAAAGGALK